MKLNNYTKHVHLILLLLCGLQWAFSQAPVIQQVTPVATSVGRFQKFEIAITLTAGYSNPYDYDEILVSAEFTAPSGKKEVMEGFFMENYTLNTSTGNITPTGVSQFMVRYAPSELGTYTYRVTCTNTQGTANADGFSFQSQASSAKGFVRKNSTNYLNFDNGQQYVIVGQNLSWQQNNKYLNYKTWTDRLSENGANFIRLWQCAWGLGIEWSGTPYNGLKRYSQVNSFYTDKLLEECEAKDIYMMLCINHHGMVSSTVNPNWNENPYKSTNGGPCVNTWDYFINSTAKALHKNRLRYIIARWGYSRNIMSWELFNEVEWTDNFQTYKNQIKDWHQEMAAYLKQKDPFKHLVTTSYAHDNEDPNTWNLPEIDFTQTHYYNGSANVETVLVNGVQSYLNQFSKPTYTGEFGINTSQSNLSSIDPNGIHIHNSLWATLFSGGMGTGATWWWDTYIAPQNLYYHYKAPAILANQLPLQAANYKPVSGSVTGGGSSDLSISPGAGWGKPPANSFTINADGVMTPSASSLSTYMYGTQCKANEKNSPTFSVTYPASGEFRVRTGNDISTFCNAQRVQILLNGNEVLNNLATANTTYTIQVPAGTHTIKVDNAGGDWYTVSSYTFTNLGKPLNTYLLKSADKKRVAGWVHNKRYNWIDAGPGKPAPPVITGASISVPDMANGNYEVKWFECIDGTVTQSSNIQVVNGTLTVPIPNVAWDLAFMANEATTLPIRLASFKGIYEKHQNTLFIQIAASENVEKIMVERSANGYEFSSIGMLQAAANDYRGNHTFYDANRIAGKNFYRLKITDRDGSKQYSDVILIQPSSNETGFRIYPNPAGNTIHLLANDLQDIVSLKFQVHNNIGQAVLSLQIPVQNTKVNEQVQLTGLPNGLYYYTLYDDKGMIRKSDKLIKR
ncbi:MAG: DUF5060 domain-containing protein [Chitinophagaceae bacterium]|nr:DUF5060 domain-containing protein [Chitinophagaceae bacterium]